MTPRYPYVIVDVNADEAESAAEILFEVGASGLEERDATTLGTSLAGKTRLVASFESHDEARAASGELPPRWSPRVEEIVGDAWRDEWKKHFEPFVLAGNITVCPPWHLVKAQPGQHVIVLEPGRAFGTGLHETTSLVAEVLAEQASQLRGLPVLDVGCGSGILSLVALALGASKARAVDIDPESVLVTRENAQRNAMENRVDVDQSPVMTLTERYPTVVANIEAHTLIALAPALRRCVAPGGMLVLSGLLAPDVGPAQREQLTAVRREFQALSEGDLRRRGQWVAVVLRA